MIEAKSSFFNLMRENFKRRIALPTCVSVLFFFIFPVSSMMNADNYMRNSAMTLSGAVDMAATNKYIYNYFISAHDALGGVFVFTTIIAVVSAVSAYGYLHNSRKTDFYHSLPVSRAKLFTISALNSLIMTAVPYIVMAMLSAAIIAAKSGYTSCFSYAAVNVFYGMCFFTLTFMTAALAMLLTGTALTGVLAVAVLLFGGPALILTVDTMMETYYWSYLRIGELMDAMIARTSPVLWAEVGGGTVMFRAIIAVIAAAILYVLCLKLYNMRHSELAGTPVVFKPIKAPIKMLVTIPGALLCGVFAGSMSGHSDIWTVFAIVCGVVIIHSIIEIIYNADLKELFSHRLQLGVCLVVSLFAYAFFRFDLAGYDRYQPDMSRVESAAVYSYSMEQVYGNEDYLEISADGEDVYLSHSRNELDVLNDMHITDKAGLKRIDDISTAGIETFDMLKQAGGKNDRYYYGTAEDELGFSPISIAWHLDNGRTIYRRYNFDLNKVSADIEAIHDSLEFKMAVYPILRKNAEGINDIVGIKYKDAFGTHTLEADLDEDANIAGVKALSATTSTANDSGTAIAAGADAAAAETETEISSESNSLSAASDVSAGNANAAASASDSRAAADIFNIYTKELAGLTAETRRQESPVAGIQFRTYKMQLMEDILKRNSGYVSLIDDTCNYPIYPSFTDTIEALKEYGAELNAGLSADNILSIVIEDTHEYNGVEDESGRPKKAKPELVVTDKGEIQEVMDSLAYNINMENELNPKYYGLYAELKFDKSGSSFKGQQPDYNSFVNGVSFDSDKIPQFVREYFEIDDETLYDSTGRVAW